MEELFDKLLGNNVVAPEIYSSDIVALNLIITLGLAMVIGLTYKKVHKGISYSQSYVYSIVLVAMVVCLAMMVIGNDITRAFALLGTFTIIRYRTAVKDPKDTAFIFIALVVGLAVGSSNYGIAITGSMIMCLTALFLDKIDFGAAVKLEHVLYLTLDARKSEQDELEKVMKKSFLKSSLLNVNYLNSQHQLIYTYNVTAKKSVKPESATSEIQELKGIQSVELLASQNMVEF